MSIMISNANEILVHKLLLKLDSRLLTNILYFEYCWSWNEPLASVVAAITFLQILCILNLFHPKLHV